MKIVKNNTIVKLIKPLLLTGLVILFLHLNKQHWIHSNIINIIKLYVWLFIGTISIDYITKKYFKVNI